jgi:hypothetical protein
MRCLKAFDERIAARHPYQGAEEVCEPERFSFFGGSAIRRRILGP